MLADPHLKSNALERSNVNAMDEMVHLMSAYRGVRSSPEDAEDTHDGHGHKLVQELGKLS